MNTAPLPFVSIIIPTYNRKGSLRRTLDGLARQTYPANRFEVIVVDDGSSDGTEEVAQHPFPFALRYMRQHNQGDAKARNRGAMEAQGDYLQFLDDDIVVECGFIAAVIGEHMSDDKLMVIGRLLPMPSSSPSVFERRTLYSQDTLRDRSGELDFAQILSGVLSLRREHYLTLGMMQPVAKSGSSVWCDVEFSYRAYRKGLRLSLAANAIAYHDDYALRDFGTSCQRTYRVAAVGAELFQRHPELEPFIPMFSDKGPIAWRQDPLSLILRKLARQAASSRPAMWAMQTAVPFFERRAPDSTLLALFYRWISSGYIYRGYRAGLQSIGEAPARLQ